MLRTPVSVYMTREPAVIPVGVNLEEAALRLDARRVSAMPVVNNEGRALGVLSRRDLLEAGKLVRPDGQRVLEWRLPNALVDDIMSKEIISVAPNTALGEAAALMLDARVHRVFVERGGALRGVLTTRDVMQAIVDHRLDAKLSRYMHVGVESIAHIGPLGFAQKQLRELGVRGLVVAWEGRPVGIFAEEEALASRDMDADTPVERVMSHEVLVESPDLPIHMAAGRMASMHARRMVVVSDGAMVGLLTGFDLAGAAALEGQ
jgi:CBS domain-containing protein